MWKQNNLLKELSIFLNNNIIIIFSTKHRKMATDSMNLNIRWVLKE